MTKAIIWCRVSTTQQEFESQKQDLINQAIKDGFVDDDSRIVIGEAGASAIKMNEVYQKEVNKLIQTIDTVPNVSTIYVWEVSRLARNEIAFYQMKDKIIKSKIQLICNVPQIKLLDDTGEVNHGMEITLNLLVTLAKQEMEIKMKRFDRGRRRKAEEGKWSGGTLSFGYTVDKNRDNLIVVNEEEAALVQEVYNMYEQGYSQVKIAQEFFERGLNEMGLHRINHILKNERYTGKRMKGEGAYERAFPPIISQEQFERCRKIADTNNLNLSKARNIYYGDHILRCYKCGRYCDVQSVCYHCYDAYNRFKKYSNLTNPENCDNHLNISVNILDSLLWYAAIEVETDYILHSAQQDRDLYLDKIEKLKAKFENIDKRLAKIDLKRKRIRDVYLEGDLSVEERDKRYQRIEDERREVLNEKLSYENDIEHYEALLENVLSKYNFHNSESLEVDLEQISSLAQQIANIESDKERYDIIHRHFRKITFESATVELDFKIGRRKAKASFIKIELYNDKVLYYYFIPNNGKNGGYYMADAEGNILEEVFPKYLKRFWDKGKVKRRLEGRANRKAKKDELYPNDGTYLYGMDEIGRFLNVNAATARYWVSPEGPAGKITKRFGRNLVVPKKELIEILQHARSKKAKAAVKYALEHMNDQEEK